mmetsp:Transcript_21165/g.49257  ORF Transcript_21165/g.49257 Transcript_21165/m.49257 type:complete len:731 (+) Transcript_21165:34-2226(+)
MLAPIRGQIAEDTGCFQTRRGISPPVLSSLDSTLERDERKTSWSRPTTRGSPTDDLLRLETPRTSRCHPGCFTPEVQERPDASFRRLEAPEQQGMASPSKGRPVGAWAWQGLDPLDRRGAASAPPMLPAAGCEVQTTPEPCPSPGFWRRLQPELAESLKILGRPHAVWQADLCRAVRRKASEHPGPEEAALLQKLQFCVKQATEFALKRGHYQVDRSDGPGYRTVNLTQALSPYPFVQWFDTYTSFMEGTDLELGKAVPPPLLVTDSSSFDIVGHLRSFGHTNRDIFVVAELLEFDAEGSLTFGQTSLRPHCAQLRTDFRSFYLQAEAQLNKGRASMQQSLCDLNFPKVFVAHDVTCIRGSQGHGYPFLGSPVRCHIIATSLWTNRPSLRIARNESGERITVYKEGEDIKAYQLRLELCAHSALKAAGVGIDATPAQKPALILPVLGLGGNSFHPEDAVALALKAFRRRFAQFFHSVYVCCGDRGPNYSMSDFVEEAVNKSVYMMAQNDTLAAKALPWHWDKREIQLSVATARLEKIGQVLRLGPLYVVEVHEDRRTKERRKIAQKQEVHGFGTLRAYKQKRQMEAADELIKAQRRQGDWPADHVHVKLGGLQDHLVMLDEIEEMDQRRMQVQRSIRKVDEEINSPRRGENDLAYLQELLVASAKSTKQRATAWILRTDELPRRLSNNANSLDAARAKRGSKAERRLSVEDFVASQDVMLATGPHIRGVS